MPARTTTLGTFSGLRAHGPRKFLAIAALLFAAQALAAGSLRADDTLIVGTSFQIDTLALGFDTFPDVAVHSDGSYVVVWQSVGSAGTDSDATSIQARLYDTSGTPVAAPFQVNNLTTGEQTAPSIAMATDGSFVVVWTSVASPGDTSGTSVQLRRFDSVGAPLAGEVQVNSTTSGDQATGALWDSFESIAMSPGGGFVVVWLGSGVRAQLYSGAGAAVGSEFQVDSSGSSEGAPSVAMASDGRFLVVWQASGGVGHDAAGSSIQGRRYSAGGSPEGSQFEANSLPVGSQRNPRAAYFSSGEFVVVWDTFITFPAFPFSESSVLVRRFDASATPIFVELEINWAMWEGYPAVAIETNGEFVVTWTRGTFPFENPNVWAQRFSELGFPLGDEQIINDGSAFHELPAISSGQAGEFVIVWGNPGFDGQGPYKILGSLTELAELDEVPSLTVSRLALLVGLMAAAGAVATKRRMRRA